MTEAWLIRLLALACLGFAATCGVFWGRRRSYARQVAKLHTDIVESAEAAAFGKRVSLTGTPPELGELGSTVNLLFDALESKDAQMRQRETLFHDLANTLPDLVLVQTSPPQQDGTVSLGVSVGPNLDFVRSARVVIAEFNPNMPVTAGDSRIAPRGDSRGTGKRPGGPLGAPLTSL